MMKKRTIYYIIPLLLLFVSIPSMQAQVNQNTVKSSEQGAAITGVVTDDTGTPLVGVTIRLVSMKPSHKLLGYAVTDANGEFRINGNGKNLYVTANYVGFKGNTISVEPGKRVVIKLNPDVNELKETVVTGYFSKAKNSFTGTAVQVTGDELREVNNTSIFDALKVFDPSFQVVDTYGTFGSDPNHVPDKIEIRGQNTMPDISQSNLETITSLPIFILDGFEVSVSKIYDLDMNRIKSVTVLKDASASAIYGSRAANGVVVIETKSPEAGKLQISYTLNGKFEIPDLSSYNLMNASEALEFQKAAGIFDAYKPGEDGGNNLNSYNAVKRAVLSGVDTYWLKKPLRLGFQQKHTLMIDGSVGKQENSNDGVRFSVDLGVGNTEGVMKESGRTSYSAGTKLIYNSKRINISNDLQFSMVKSNESPYGSFSTYTKAQPYYTDRDENGNYYRTLSIANMAPVGMSLGVTASQQSPIYEAKYLNSYTTAETMNVTNNLSVNWRLLHDLRIKGTFSLSYDYGRNDAYISPGSFAYINNNSNSTTTPDELYKRGKYSLFTCEIYNFLSSMTFIQAQHWFWRYRNFF